AKYVRRWVWGGVREGIQRYYRTEGRQHRALAELLARAGRVLALEEAARVARSHIVVETYKVKHPLALDYGVDELITQLAKWKIVRRNVRRDMQNFVISPAP
ncbi:MAG: hypothetical protein ACP5IE_02195, partial [Infirmifilum sp.]